MIVVVASIYLFTATRRAILDDGDALYAHIGQQMAKSGDWVTPYANGVRFLDKPPMMYWLMASSYHLFGFNEFAARFPSVLAVLGISILLFLMGKTVGGHSCGFIAGMSAALCMGTFLFTRMVFPDVLFVFFLTLSIYCFLRWYLDKTNPLLPAVVFYAALAGAVLTKGLMGVAFPVAVVVCFLLWSGDFRRLQRFHIWKGGFLFLFLAVPWHTLAAQRNPGFLWYFFVNEQLLRFIGKRQPFDYESISLPIFWALLLVWLFPWTVFLPAIRHLFRVDAALQSQACSIVRLCICWVAVVGVFFSLSSRIEHYSMPLFPPLLLLVGIVLAPANASLESESRRSIEYGFAILGILGGILALILLAVSLWLAWFSAGTPLTGEAGRLHAYKYYFAPLFEMPAEIVGRLKFPLLGTLFCFSLGLLTAWWVGRRGQRLAAVLVLSAMMMCFCLFTFQSLGVCEEILSSKQFGQKLNQLYRPGDTTIVMGDYETANSINFYAAASLDVCGGTAALLQWGLRYPDAPGRVLTFSRLQEMWGRSQRIFLLVPDDRIRSLNFKNLFFVMRSGGRTLFCNISLPQN
jgi:4-amino-4-deoxy-L-arabinose transferase-like glycosyltransferase